MQIHLAEVSANLMCFPLITQCHLLICIRHTSLVIINSKGRQNNRSKNMFDNTIKKCVCSAFWVIFVIHFCYFVHFLFLNLNTLKENLKTYCTWQLVSTFWIITLLQTVLYAFGFDSIHLPITIILTLAHIVYLPL